jgi:hypothetical protein
MKVLISSEIFVNSDMAGFLDVNSAGGFDTISEDSYKKEAMRIAIRPSVSEYSSES